MKQINYRRNSFLATAAALALLVNQASAGTTWNGNAAATSGNWDSGANWEGTAPTFNASTDLLFRNTSANNRITSVIQQDRTVRSLTFNSNVTTGFEIRFNVANNNAAKNMTMGDGSNAAAITVDSGAAGNITIGKGGGAVNGNLILANNLAVAQNSTSATLTIDAPITESGGARTLTKSGDGALVLSGANTYTGATTNNQGTLALGNGGTGGSLSTNSTIVNNGNLTVNQSDTVTQGADFSGSAITGSGSLTKIGSGTLTLSATNTYTGATSVSNGVLKLTLAEALARDTAVNISTTTGAKIDLAFDGTVTVKSLTVNGELLKIKKVYSSANLPNVLSGSGLLYTLEGAPPKGSVILLR
jgi:autotransporter-associated beta strand protein